MSKNVELAATGNSDWVTLRGPRTVRVFGTWAGSYQFECKGLNDDDADRSTVGESETANGTHKINIERNEKFLFRIAFTRTLGTLKAQF